MVQVKRRTAGEGAVGRDVRWVSDRLPDEAEGSERPFIPRIRPVGRRASANERQDALVDFLDQLCTKEPVTIASDVHAARRYYRFFKDVYLGGGGFRHSYSEICRLVYDKVSPYESDRQLLISIPPELSNLRHNLDAVISTLSVLRNRLRSRWHSAKQQYEFPDFDPGVTCDEEEALREIDELRKGAEELEEIIKRVTKLYDHVSMEVERLAYMVRQNKCNSDAILEASNTVDRAVAEKEKQLKGLSDEIERTKKDVQRDNIAVLGIFAAVVLVVNGAVSFSASSLEAIGTGRGVAPVFLMAVIVGFVVINAVGLMLSYIWRMTMWDRPQIDGWPKWAWISADVVLILLIVLLSLTRFPWFRDFVHLVPLG